MSPAKCAGGALIGPGLRVLRNVCLHARSVIVKVHTLIYLFLLKLTTMNNRRASIVYGAPRNGRKFV